MYFILYDEFKNVFRLLIFFAIKKNVYKKQIGNSFFVKLYIYLKIIEINLIIVKLNFNFMTSYFTLNYKF